MKLSLYFIASLITISSIQYVYAQNGSLHDVKEVIQHMTEALDTNNSCHYTAQMGFKAFGSDSFEIRNFTISYKTNADNPLYGYDWEISEEMDSGYAFTFMALPKDLYVIYEGNKGIGHQSLPKTIDLGSLIEYLRNYLVLHEMLIPFANVSPTDIMMKDSGNYYFLTREMHESATRQLMVSKDSYLPVQFIGTYLDNELSFAQIDEINFYYDEHFRQLPDTAFSINHYLSLGYTLHENEEIVPSEQEEMIIISPESREFLLNYPFVKESGDTTTIHSIKSSFILLDFWYSSCVPCLKALPEINQLAEEYADKGLAVLGINCFDKSFSDNLVTKLRAKNINIPLYFGSGDLLRVLQLNSFPSYILITPNRDVEFIEGFMDDVKKVIGDIYNK